MDLTSPRSHLTENAAAHLRALVMQLESRTIDRAVQSSICGQASTEYAEATQLANAARGALLEAVDALAWPGLHERRAAALDEPLTPRYVELP